MTDFTLTGMAANWSITGTNFIAGAFPVWERDPLIKKSFM